MSDDPSNWELARRLDQIYGSVQALIGRAEYAEYQKHIDRQISAMQKDIEAIRTEHADYVKTTTSHRQWKTMVYTGLVPALVSLAAILVTLAMHNGG